MAEVNATASSAPPPPQRLQSKMFSFIAPRAAVAEKTFLETTQLTELGALRMLLFLHLQMLRVAHPVLSAAFSKRYSAQEGKYVVSLTPWRVQQQLRGADWVDNSALSASTIGTILQLAEAIAAADRTPERFAGIGGLSHADFLRSGLRAAVEAEQDENAAEPGLLGLSPGSSAIDALLQLGGELASIVRQALQELAYDVLFSASQVCALSELALPTIAA
jgi:hypothetical protein